MSSPGLEEYLPDQNPVALAAGVQQLVPTLKYANTHQRGYMVLSVTPQEARADWYLVDTVKSTTYALALAKSLKAQAGPGNLQIVQA